MHRPESSCQFEKDLAVQWKMVFDKGNLARRAWRRHMGEAQRKEWVRTKPVRSEYSLPRESAKRMHENYVLVTELLTYVS